MGLSGLFTWPFQPILSPVGSILQGAMPGGQGIKNRKEEAWEV